jgi:hypothetical protein
MSALAQDSEAQIRAREALHQKVQELQTHPQAATNPAPKTTKPAPEVNKEAPEIPTAAPAPMMPKPALGMGGETKDPLLDLMIQKGMVTQEEAARVRAEADALRTNALVNAMPPPESKWKLSNGLKSVELFGDLRLRYEHRQANAPDDSRIELDRIRYSVRVGLRGEVFDDWYYGVRLDTSANSRSAWSTLGSSSSGVPYQGPFGKSSGGINVGQVYIGWKPADWLDIGVGKMPNPLYTTPMVWDSDINPEGLAERLKFKVGNADFFATFGQFLYEDPNPLYNTPGFFNINANNSKPSFMLAWQAGMNYHINEKLSVKLAATLYNYTGYGPNNTAPGAALIPDFGGTYVGEGATNNLNGRSSGAWSGYPTGYYDGFTANQTGIRNLLIFEIPAEFNLKLGSMNLRVFGDYAQNLQGANRAREAYSASQSAFQPQDSAGIATVSSPQTDDASAYQVGIAVGNKDSLGLVYGSTVKRHAWEARAYWQHIEQYALDINLIDSDFFEGRANLEGVFAALAYGFTDNIVGTFRYGYARRINDKLGTGGSNQDIPQINPIGTYHLLQFDLTFKF